MHSQVQPVIKAYPVLKWVNRLFLFLNIFAACSVVGMYASMKTMGLEISEQMYGTNAPLMGSKLLNILVGWPQSIVVAIILFFAAKMVFSMKKQEKRFVYNIGFLLLIWLMASIVIVLFFLPIHELGSI